MTAPLPHVEGGRVRRPVPPPARIAVEAVALARGGRPVLKGVSFGVVPGEVVAVVGQSGGGKSSLLRVVAGLLAPDAGRVLLSGADLARLGRRPRRAALRQVGMLFQGGALFDTLSAYENVAYPLRGHGRALVGGRGPFPEAEVRDRALAALDAVGMADHWAKRPSELSGGQQKRVALARATVTEPTVLLCDEPTSGLDPRTAANTDALVRTLARRLGAACLVVTHDLAALPRLADRVVFLHDGRAHFVGSPQDLAASPDPVLQATLHPFAPDTP